ncbi:hypothetical protein LSG31_22385 [Fodinisporobacter ferrooxydans]|uniref:Uncharacterized protein n=1 Tax=Fodinisporobacter ferrooxydans TaxID=2901836 RepID=A0ABY4CRT4_9BACL|nr:hypothetical protein LSG31_22385 [Alicyclobacillaceae bacterium MYW30-H2]
MKQYLHEAIAEDNTSGAEYFLASIVQDAVIHECFETEDDENLKKMAHRAARLAINSVHESMGINSFIVCETVRGVIHGLVALGGDPTIMTREAIRGFCMEAQQTGLPFHDVTRGIHVGIRMTARDLGIDEEQLFSLVSEELSKSMSQEEQLIPSDLPTTPASLQISATIHPMESDTKNAVIESLDQLEQEVEVLINKTLSARRKRPYLRYKHGKVKE